MNWTVFIPIILFTVVKYVTEIRKTKSVSTTHKVQIMTPMKTAPKVSSKEIGSLGSGAIAGARDTVHEGDERRRL